MRVPLVVLSVFSVFRAESPSVVIDDCCDMHHAFDRLRWRLEVVAVCHMTCIMAAASGTKKHVSLKRAPNSDQGAAANQRSANSG